MATLTSSHPRTVYLVEEQLNPSTDFFILPSLQASGYTIQRCRFTDVPTAPSLIGSIVIFVRYIPPVWAKLIKRMRPKLHTLIFFMDDDVLDWSSSRGMPWHYRHKLARLSASRKTWLQQQKAKLWVSTQYLQDKYATWQPVLVLPMPVQPPPTALRVFYHGSASHGEEIRWLQPIITEVLQRDDNLVFEIIGGQPVNKLYKKLSRVNVIHPMKWTSYQALMAMQPRHIGLNPLHDLPFNQARSYTKFFDITRCKAVGIYSPNSACAEIISHEKDGLIVELDQEAWVSAILQLAHDAQLRAKLLVNAEAKMSALAIEAQRNNLAMLEASLSKQ